MFSRMRSEGFPFIVWGSGGWTLVRLELLVASASGRRRVVVASLIPCLWGKLQNLSFSKVSTQLSCRFAWQALHFVTFQPACYRVESFKLEEVSHQMLVLLRPRVSSRVSAFPLASPCLGGKLQNLLRFAASTPRVSSRVSAFPLTSPCLWGKLQNLSLCFSSGVAVSMGEAAKPCSFCCLWFSVASPCLGVLFEGFLAGCHVRLGSALCKLCSTK